jgi:hypothetical protein
VESGRGRRLELLLSPIFGSILVRKNWQALEEPDKVRSGSLWIGLSVLMALASMAVGFVGFVYIVIWYFAFQRPQATYIRERWGKSYARRGWLVPVLAGFGAWIGVVVVVFLVFFAIGAAAR